ncbi:MAG: 16S rRNA (cytosine(1402)-N(4))-methyltransferase, partial [Chitinivibrionales bacterium]|nr:16S rRNA (cytosine(1402)-N(4))-methyltransferase [Chitinivibrionales bacterium]
MLMVDGNLTYHVPVMRAQCMEGLVLKPSGTYLDCTLGGGGHFRSITEALNENGVAVGIDRDPEAIAWAKAKLPESRGRVI